MAFVFLLVLVLIAGVVGVAFVIANQSAKDSAAEPSSPSSEAAQTYRYQRQKALLTPAEVAFYRVLSRAIADQYLVFSKVRVADVLTPESSSNRGEWQRAFNKISAKHFDFLICDKDSLGVIAAIELDDKSHRQTNRIKRDDFLNQAVDSAGLALIRIPVQASYDVEEVRNQLVSTLTPPVRPPNSTPKPIRRAAK